MDNITKQQIALLIIGALISLVSSVIGFSIQEISKNLVKKVGKVNIYRKIVYQKNTQGDTWGFFNHSEGIIFSVPLWIEIHNSKNTVEVVRNFNLVLYQDGHIIKKMTQINSSGDGSNKFTYGNEGAYSFMINPRSIKRYDLLFYTKKREVLSDFNEVRVQFYDTKNKIKEYKLINNLECWKMDNKKVDDDWIQLT